MEETHGKGPRYGMTIDLDKCTGCGTCMIACAAENNVTVLPDESDKQRNIAWMLLYKITNGKPFPHTEVSYFPRPCMQCDHHAPCVSVCPATATRMDPNTGIVSQIYTRCIGCRYCMAACPYGSRSFNWRNPRPFVQNIQEKFPTRMRGVVEKCNFCAERLAVGKQPACVEASKGAMIFGDLSDPDSEIRKVLKENYTIRRKQELGTGPSVYYIV